MSTDVESGQQHCWSSRAATRPRSSAVPTLCSGPPTSTMSGRCARSTGTSSPRTRHSVEWRDLDAWVDWLRAHLRPAADGDPAVVASPRRADLGTLGAAHRTGSTPTTPTAHPRLRWRGIATSPSARNRLREWVSLCGTRLDRDRPTRQTAWPGEAPYEPASRSRSSTATPTSRAFVAEDVAARRAIEDRARVRLVVARLAVHSCSLHPVVHSHDHPCSAYPPAGSHGGRQRHLQLERTPPCCSPTR